MMKQVLDYLNGKTIAKIDGLLPLEYKQGDEESFTALRFTFTDGLTYSVGVPEPDYESLGDVSDETWDWYEARR